VYKFKITIAYDGTHYSGWQLQNNSITIQFLLQEALQTVLRTPTLVTGSGRTDAGVHALGQVAHFTSEIDLNLYSFAHSVNSLLPHDISLLSIDPVPEEFHARYSAKAKIYHYYLHTDRVLNPFTRLYRTHLLYPIDRELFRKSLNLFIGTHDFTSFANEASLGAAAKNPIKTISRIDLFEERSGLRIEFEGNGFLYKMVRNMVGTALEVASGKINIDHLAKLFSAKDRRLAGQTASPEGLFLAEVIY